jgi:catechol 2,3-dioxygenase-like lactoylglutathione lyase family enzyme
MLRILYCRQWDETVAFYRNTLGLYSKRIADWLVEFEVAPIRDNYLGGQAFFLRDPEGNRLEFWSESLVNQ